MLAIHVGIEPDLLPAFEKFIKKNLGKKVKTDGDQWDNWGEECDNSDQPQHVYFTTSTPMVELNFLVNALGIFLSEINADDELFPGRRILVTDGKDFDEFYVELSFPE